MGWIFFIFRYYWHNNFTSAIISSIHSLLVFFDFWRWFFTSVASILCFFFHFFWSWHNIFTSAFIFAWCWHILFMSLQWFSLIFLYWHMFFMSVQRISQKACFFHTTDIKNLCQRNHRVTVLSPVRFEFKNLLDFKLKFKQNAS